MKKAISVENLTVSYGNIGAVNDLNLEIEKGEFLGIIGPNGGGKTTLINAVLGIIKPVCGKIKILENDVKKARSKIGYVPQTAQVDRDFPITVSETVLSAFLKSGLHPLKKFSKEEKERAMEVLALVGISEKSKHLISELSGGEFQKLLIARALVTNPVILLLDEPTSNIDKESRENIYSLLKNLNKNGVTVIMVTHDLQSINRIFSRIVYINQSVLYDGLPSDFLKETAYD